MPLRRISSILTVFYKFILPAIFAIGIVNVWIIWGARSLHPKEDIPVWFFYVIPFFLLVTSILSAWRLKWVAIDAANLRLYVSNYRKEIAIPFSEIANVTEFRFSDPRRITIHLPNETEFGKKIVFIGTYRFLGIWAGPHPIVDELQNLAHGDQTNGIPKLGPRF
ncbi:MAG: hypothetical protein ABJB40_10960 [Acidobacteriota bacterium]